MKNIIIKIFLTICIVGRFLITEMMTVYAQEESGKVIAIVYDNSSSMTFDDREDFIETFRTRWVEADYALRAFLNCRDDKDIIMIYPINDDDGEPVVIDDKIETVVNQVSSKFYGKTPYNQVETAVSKLKEEEYQYMEKWLIILTDGQFNENGKLIDFSNKLQETLGENIEDIAVLYVPMTGDESENDDEEKSSAYLFSSDELEKFGDKVIQVHENSIQQQILQCNNIIYKRNILSLSSEEQGKQNVKIDVPLKELIVLIQKEGNEQNFQTEDMEDSENEEEVNDLQAKLENIVKELETDTGDVAYTQKQFQTYSGNAPEYIGNELKEEMKTNPDYFISNLRTKSIEGYMAYLHWDQCNINEENQIDFNISLDNKETIEFYYQLNFDIEIEVEQDGKIVNEGELHEGEYEVTVLPVTTGDSRERISTDAKLLDGVAFSINKNSCVPGEKQKFKAEYGKQVKLTAKASGSAIEDEISETRTFSVNENIYPLKISVEQRGTFDYDAMNSESKRRGEAPFIEVVLSEEGIDGELISLRETTIQNLQFNVNIDCDEDKKSEKPKIESQIEVGDNGRSYYIYPMLTDQSDTSVYHNATCTITAYRQDAEKESICTVKTKLDLVAHEIPVQARLADGVEYSYWDCINGNVEALIYCDGEEISESEMKNIKFIAKENDVSKKIFGDFGNIFYWFFYENKEIPVSKEVIYTRRGVPCMTVLEGIVLYDPVPRGIQIMGGMIILIIILFLFYVIFRELSGRCFSPFFKAYIKVEEPLGREIEKIKIKGKLWNVIFNKPIVLILNCDIDRKIEDFPNMKLKKIPGKAKMIVVNGEEFSNKQYRVEGRIIITDIIIDFDRSIKIVNSNGLHYELSFKTKEEGEA